MLPIDLAVGGYIDWNWSFAPCGQWNAFCTAIQGRQTGIKKYWPISLSRCKIVITPHENIVRRSPMQFRPAHKHTQHTEYRRSLSHSLVPSTLFRLWLCALRCVLKAMSYRNYVDGIEWYINSTDKNRLLCHFFLYAVRWHIQFWANWTHTYTSTRNKLLDNRADKHNCWVLICVPQNFVLLLRHSLVFVLFVFASTRDKSSRLTTIIRRWVNIFLCQLIDSFCRAHSEWVSEKEREMSMCRIGMTVAENWSCYGGGGEQCQDKWSSRCRALLSFSTFFLYWYVHTACPYTPH